jgi:hypothetical protein
MSEKIISLSSEDRIYTYIHTHIHTEYVRTYILYIHT